MCEASPERAPGHRRVAALELAHLFGGVLVLLRLFLGLLLGRGAGAGVVLLGPFGGGELALLSWQS